MNIETDLYEVAFQHSTIFCGFPTTIPHVSPPPVVDPRFFNPLDKIPNRATRLG